MLTYRLKSSHVTNNKRNNFLYNWPNVFPDYFLYNRPNAFSQHNERQIRTRKSRIN